MYPWTYVFTDRGGNGLSHGEIHDPDSRRYSGALQRAATAGVTVRAEDPVVREILALNYEVRLKAYLGASLMFHGDLSSYQRVSEGGKRTIAFTAVDPYGFSFGKRLLNRTPTPYTLGPATRESLARQMIAANSGEALSGSEAHQSNHEVRTGTLGGSGGATITYSMPPFKPLNEFVAEMAAGVSGFEWRLVPIEAAVNTLGGGGATIAYYIADWKAADTLGTLKPDVIFAHGIGLNNITRAEEVGDMATSANDLYHISETGPDSPGAPIVNAQNTTGLGGITTYGHLSDIVQAQITDPTLRSQLVTDHKDLRGGFRRVFSFQPAVYDASQPNRVPQFGRDFELGDIVRARAADPMGIWFDGFVRVWGVEIAPDKLGKSTTTLTLIED